MNETMWWISRHLDDYHFNSDRARALKREIQQWTTLPRQDQERTGDELLRRFHTLFSNNPFLEQNGLVGDGRQGADSFAEKQGLSGEITGATADAYFLNDRHFTLRPTVSGRKDPKCFYLDGNAENALYTSQKTAADTQRARYQDLCNESVARVSKKYNYILAKTVSSQKGGMMTSPTVPRAIFCILYYVLAAAVLSQWWTYWTTYRQQTAGSDFWQDYAVLIPMVTAGLVVLVGLVRLKPMLNTIVKGFYRYVFRVKYARYQERVQKSRDRVRSLPVDQWFQQFRGAISDTRERFRKDPDALPIQDSTRALLKKQPGKTLLGDVLDMDPPWNKYSPEGEASLTGMVPMVMLALAGIGGNQMLVELTNNLIRLS